MWQLFLIEIQGRALSCFVHADIGDVGQPPGRGFVEMFERRESAAVEEVLFQVPEGTFDFSLRLPVARSAGDRPEPIIGGESQKAGVVNRLLTVMATDHDFHVVVETIGGDAFEIREGLNMLANRGDEVLTFNKMYILAAA